CATRALRVVDRRSRRTAGRSRRGVGRQSLHRAGRGLQARRRRQDPRRPRQGREARPQDVHAAGRHAGRQVDPRARGPLRDEERGRLGRGEDRLGRAGPATEGVLAVTVNLGWVDIALLAILGLSVLVGLWRGFVFEIVSLLGWVIAFIFANTGAPLLSP